MLPTSCARTPNPPVSSCGCGVLLAGPLDAGHPHQRTTQGQTTPEEYTGGRDADGIVKFINGKTGLSRKVKKTPSAVVDLTPANFDSVVNGDKHAFLEFYAPWWWVRCFAWRVVWSCL